LNPKMPANARKTIEKLNKKSQLDLKRIGEISLDDAREQCKGDYTKEVRMVKSLLWLYANTKMNDRTFTYLMGYSGLSKKQVEDWANNEDEWN